VGSSVRLACDHLTSQMIAMTTSAMSRTVITLPKTHPSALMWSLSYITPQP
jgi:hypothetical protein